MDDVIDLPPLVAAAQNAYRQRIDTYERVLGMDPALARLHAQESVEDRISHLRLLIEETVHVSPGTYPSVAALNSVDPKGDLVDWDRSARRYEDLAIVACEIRDELIRGAAPATWWQYFQMAQLLADRAGKVRELMAMLKMRTAERAG